LARVLPATPAAIGEAIRLLRASRLVAFPTETVYGLGALAGDPGAVAAVYRVKRRPAHNPLIAHVADSVAARRIAAFNACGDRLAEAFWPGPLTLVLPLAARAEIAPAATAGLSTVAVRVPSHPTAQALLREVGLPVVAPSANPSGRVSPTTAQHVAAELGEAVDLVLDGGPCPVGLESTVVDLSDPEHARLLRPGGLPRDRLESLLGELRTAAPTDRPSSPGQLASHYAPRLPIRLDAGSVEPDEALLAFGPNPPTDALAMLNLSPTGDLAEAARNLFAMLHDLDRSGAARIAVMPIPAEGLGEAIRDRLRRAAAPRPG
jgi:L-threonylcarbamoyladenylate synthase